ncbi:DUF4221 family protein [Penaeicola halotolerans]|uniref:DUF4221 family protein n=1 Tax=Penaeicola halotolerans TaxID=2793196 RepID=UPI001CF82CC0|nr:DUF4221 family protein [Penaeicola halotolerans]
MKSLSFFFTLIAVFQISCQENNSTIASEDLLKAFQNRDTVTYDAVNLNYYGSGLTHHVFREKSYLVELDNRRNVLDFIATGDYESFTLYPEIEGSFALQSMIVGFGLNGDDIYVNTVFALYQGEMSDDFSLKINHRFLLSSYAISPEQTFGFYAPGEDSGLFPESEIVFTDSKTALINIFPEMYETTAGFLDYPHLLQYDVTQQKADTLPVRFPSAAQGDFGTRYPYLVSPSLLTVGSEIYVNYPFTDTVYVYDQKGTLQRKYAFSDQISFDQPAALSLDGIEVLRARGIRNYEKLAPRFLPLLHDPYRKQFYLVNQSSGLSDGNPLEPSTLKSPEGTLLVLDEELNLQGIYRIPEAYYLQPIVVPEGLLFQLKSQPVEDDITFVRFNL